MLLNCLHLLVKQRLDFDHGLITPTTRVKDVVEAKARIPRALKTLMITLRAAQRPSSFHAVERTIQNPTVMVV